MPSYSYKGPEPLDRGDGTWACPFEDCTKGDDGGMYTSDKKMGVKQHVSRSHMDKVAGQATDMFKVLAKVTQALVADMPGELYDRMEEIVEVRKVVARYLGKRYER